jgi:multiple sugar transport system substrate-binding protein
VIFYNVDHFKEAGVPLPPTEWTDQNWKWDNFLDAAKKLTKPGERWGALVYDDTGFEQIYPVNNGEPTGIYSRDGKQFTLANPKAIEAIQWAVDLTCKHQVQPERSLVRQGNSGNNLFAGGQISMIERVASTNAYFRRNSKGFVYDVAPIPAGNAAQTTTASLVLFAVTTTSKNPDAAWDLLKFMAGPDAAKIFVQEGAFIPVHKASAALLKPGDTPPASYPANIALFAKAGDHLNLNSLTNNTEGARNIYRTQLDQVFGCSISAQDLLTKVKPAVEEVLNEEV